MRSLGLDLSLAKTGWAVVDSTTSEQESGVFKTSKEFFAGPGELTRRIGFISNLIVDKVQEYRPDVIVIEGFAMRAMGRVFDLAELGGVVKNQLFYGSLSDGTKPAIYICPPKSVKSFAGNGNADKDQMAAFALQNYQLTFPDDNACDAFYLAMVGLCVSGKIFRGKHWTQKQLGVKVGTQLVRPHFAFRSRSK